MKHVIAQEHATQPEEVGWKAARQALLAHAGFPVPRFFSISRRAFDAWLAPIEGELRERLLAVDLDRGPAGLAPIRDWLAARELPVDIRREIEAATAATFAPDEALAVRGCFVGAVAEDSAAEPFAGASESFLDVAPASVPDHVQRVFASIVTLPALLYRRRSGMDLLAHSVSVIVQHLVRAETSFVAFTRDPSSGAREVVVAAAPGPGEGVVQERAAIDHFHLSHEGKLVRSELAGEAPVLDASELERIAALALRAEEVLAAPQDLEGCVERGTVFLVQSRPLSIRRDDRVVWDNSNVTESFPGVTRPLTYSFARSFYREIFTDALGRLGLSREKLDALEPELDRMVGYLDGRVYYRLSTFYRLFGEHPLFAIYCPHWEKMIALEKSFDDDAASRRSPGTLAVAVSAARLAWTLARHEREMKRFHARFAALQADTRRDPLASLTAHELVDRVRCFTKTAFGWWGVTLVNDAFLILGFGVLERIFRRRGLLDRHPSLLTDLVCADEEIESARVVQSAIALGEELQHDPALMKVFEETAPEQVLPELERRGHARFLERVRAHQAAFGARGPADLKLEEPTPRDRPALLVEIVRRYARDGVALGPLLARERAIREEAERTLETSVQGLARPALKALLAIVRSAVRHRERSRYCRSELFATARDLYREIGERLAASGILEAADDVTFLSTDEVQGAVSGTGVALDLRALVALRKEEHARARSSDLGAHVVSHGALAARRFERSRATSDTLLSGLGSCAGIVRGPARIVLAPEDALDRARGGILVARETDPGWLYLMLAAKGLVVERGSLLSHTAIAGRKFGIPTVVGVRGALAQIQEGELIEIDGSLGTVRRVDAA